MPQLPTYNAPLASEGIHPSEEGVSAYEMAGRRIGSFYHQTGEEIGGAIDQYAASQLTDDSVKAWADLTRSWQQAAQNADPNKIDQVADDWRNKDMEDILEKHFSGADSVLGGKMAEQAKDRLRLEFLKTTGGEALAISGDALKSTLDASANTTAQVVGQHPEMFESGLNNWNFSLEQDIKTHQLAPEQAAKFRTEYRDAKAKEIAQSAFLGLAQQSPLAAQHDLDSGRFDPYFTATETKTMMAFAREQGKALDQLTRRNNEDAFKATASNITASLVQPDGSGLKVGPDYFTNVAKMATMPNADPGTVRSMFELGRSIIDSPNNVITDPHTYEDFTRRLTLPSGDPNALTDNDVINARAKNALNNKDYEFFKGALATINRDPAYRSANEQFNTFMRGIKSSITRSNIFQGTADPNGDQKFLQFSQSARDQFEQAYKAGGNAWHNLLDRNAKGSLWQQATRYMTTRAESEANLQHAASGQPVGLVPSVNAPQRQKGESAADYLKRTGGQ